MKNCDRGRENAPSIFKPRSPAVNWFYRLQMGLFTQLLSLNRVAGRLLTIWKKSWQRASNSVVDKERCIKEQIFFELLYVSCIYFTR